MELVDLKSSHIVKDLFSNDCNTGVNDDSISSVEDLKFISEIYIDASNSSDEQNDVVLEGKKLRNAAMKSKFLNEHTFKGGSHGTKRL